jgi:hypothetical protein
LHSRKRIREVELWRGKFGGEGAERFEIVALATTSAKAINTSTATSNFKIRFKLRPSTIYTNPQHHSQLLVWTASLNKPAAFWSHIPNGNPCSRIALRAYVGKRRERSWRWLEVSKIQGISPAQTTRILC